MKFNSVRSLPLLIILFISSLFWAGCSSAGLDLPDNGRGASSARDDEGGSVVAVTVITTIFPLADIIDNLGGGRVGVLGLLPSGASPHTYEPTVEQAKAVAGADLFVFIGGGVDNWVISLAQAESVETLEITANMGKHLLGYSPLYPDKAGGAARAGLDGSGQGGNQENRNGNYAGTPAASVRGVDAPGAGTPGQGYEQGSFDPHVWLDPVLVKEVIAPLITSRLKTIDPEGAIHYDKTLGEYQEKLERLHREIITTVDGFSRKEFISYHSAWKYFARRYGLEEIAAVEPFPGQEPSARWLAQLVRLAEEYRIDVLFAEPQLSSKAAQVIAGEIKGRVLILDPLGGAGIEGRECYIDLIRSNLETFQAALE